MQSAINLDPPEAVFKIFVSNVYINRRLMQRQRSSGSYDVNISHRWECVSKFGKGLIRFVPHFLPISFIAFGESERERERERYSDWV